MSGERVHGGIGLKDREAPNSGVPAELHWHPFILGPAMREGTIILFYRGPRNLQKLPHNERYTRQAGDLPRRLWSRWNPGSTCSTPKHRHRTMNSNSHTNNHNNNTLVRSSKMPQRSGWKGLQSFAKPGNTKQTQNTNDTLQPSKFQNQNE